MYKAFLIHLSVNMWSDRPGSALPPLDINAFREGLPYTWEKLYELRGYHNQAGYYKELFLDDGVWERVTRKFAERGGNMLVIDVGDAVKYKSHPEIPVANAWSIERLKDELARCRDLGLEVVPKLNFSTCHDAWLGEYHRQVSSPVYYRVCSDLIAEVAEIFDSPAIFHIGMDEEAAYMQATHSISVVRQGDLWWHDLNFLCEEVRKTGARPCMWSDKLWDLDDPGEFVRNVPKDVIQNNWYYRWIDDPVPKPGDSANLAFFRRGVKAFLQLDEMGYDILPCGSNWAYDGNIRLIVDFCKKNLKRPPLGYMTAPWLFTMPEAECVLDDAIEQFCSEIPRM
ncbi:MAG: Tat pathway signal protein [Lentisphaerae bacterium]|nr:Tat pathway signal protein [Lentisphaerota bacterium]